MFIAIEGLDGAGGETQSRILARLLRRKGKKVIILRYPDYGNPIGRLIQSFLKREFDLGADVQFSLYATDMVKDARKIRKVLDSKGFVIADRYLTTTLAYQALRGFTLDKGLKFAEIFSLPRPDIAIFLDISPQTSIARKLDEHGVLDRYERDVVFLEKVRRNYMKLIRNRIFARRWIVIDGERSVSEVTREIEAALSKYVRRLARLTVA